ncbi:hypothetical protein DL93DRAFT_141719 [Clavulina sp. PMI_390]|nr:hypothetical protein DL93DRAFT_141719 [Clavulina sp. PMI_390]
MSASKPRPRPRMRTVVSTEPTASLQTEASTSNAMTSTLSETLVSAQNSDTAYVDMFNRNKSDQVRARAKQIEAQKAASRATLDLDQEDGESSEDDGNRSSPDGKRKRGGNKLVSGTKIKGAAKWTMQASTTGRRGSERTKSPITAQVSSTRLLDSDSDEDRRSSSVEIVMDGNIRDAKGKRRAKSRSPTPPPALSEVQLKKIVNIVSTHVKENLTSQPVQHPMQMSQSAGLSSGTRADRGDGSLAVGSDGVAIRIRWLHQPSHDDGASVPADTFEFSQSRDKTLRNVFIQLTERKHISMTELVVMLNGQPITQASTPQILVGYSAHLDLTACSENTYKLMEEERQREQEAAAQHPVDHSVSAPRQTTDADGEVGGVEGDGEEVRRIAVSLRSASHPQSITFRVRLTLSVGTLLKRYLKDRGAAAGAKTRVQLDGEDLKSDATLATVLEEAGFDEDEEEVQLDVVGL